MRSGRRALGLVAAARAALAALLLAVAVLLLAAPVRARMGFSASAPVPVGARPEYLAVADLDADGRDDLVVISPASDEVQVLLGTASSTAPFANVQVYTLGEKLRRPAIGDLDGDGLLDIAIADEGGHGIWVLPGRGDGSFSIPAFVSVASGRPFAIAIGDVDSASGFDLLVADRRAGTLSILLNRGERPPRFRAGPVLAAGEGVDQVALLDLDGDGRRDVLGMRNGGRRGNDVIALYGQGMQSAAPVFSAPLRLPAGIGSTMMAAADFNSDGRADLVLLSHARQAPTSTVEVMLGTTARDFGVPSALALDCPSAQVRRRCRGRGLAAADFDMDGRADVAVAQRDPNRASHTAAPDTDAVTILRARGDGVLVGGGTYLGPRSPLAAASGDFNGDGRPDIAVAGKRNVVQVLINYSSPGDAARGESCVLGGDCRSGLCANGVCCNAICAVGARCDLPGSEGVCALP